LNSDKNQKGIVKRISEGLFWFGAAFSRLFDHSLTARIAAAVRHGVLTLSTKVIGLFFFTFGVYSFLISLLLEFFTERVVESASLYGGILMAIVSFPLLFSHGNVSTALSESVFGELVCDYLSIRRETLDKRSFTGHLSIAFVFGVIAGVLTLVIPFTTIVLFIAMAVIAGIILCSPETGMIFMTLLLFTSGPSLQYAVICLTGASYLFKIIRKKRRFRFAKTDAVLLIFAVYITGAVFFNTGNTIQSDSMRYVTLLSPYFLCVCLLRDRKRIIKVINTAVFSFGIACALYILGFAVDAVLPVGVAVDRGFLLRLMLDSPTFKSGIVPFACASLIPVALAFALRPRQSGGRLTFWLCLASMTATLIITDELAFALAAAVSCVLFLFTTGSRRIYLFLCAILAGSVAFSVSGAFGNRVYNYAFRRISEAFYTAKDLSNVSGVALSNDYALSGYGIINTSGGGDNFYAAIMTELGIAGFVILAAFMLFVISEAIVLITRTFRAKALRSSGRFVGLSSNTETRMSAIALVCSVISCLICSAFFDLHSIEAAYIMFFLECGVCVTYSRSIKNEINTAQGADLCNSMPDRSSTVL